MGADDTFPTDVVRDELGLRLCEQLGIDPAQTTEIILTVEPGIGAVVQWSGVRKLSLEEVTAAVTGTPLKSWQPDTFHEATSCGQRTLGLLEQTYLGPCVLPLGHDPHGVHRAADGAEWSATE